MTERRFILAGVVASVAPVALLGVVYLVGVGVALAQPRNITVQQSYVYGAVTRVCYDYFADAGCVVQVTGTQPQPNVDFNSVPHNFSVPHPALCALNLTTAQKVAEFDNQVGDGGTP